MKRILYFINNQHGFYLPYVLFIFNILLVLITANVSSYKNEIHITENTLEYIQLETLIQMGYVSFLEDYEPLEIGYEDSFYYQFPYGDVEMRYVQHSEHIINVQWKINTEQIPVFFLTKRLSLE